MGRLRLQRFQNGFLSLFDRVKTPVKEVKRSFASACRKAGIEAFRFHDLRQTFASQLVMRGASLKAVQELLGHASMAMTMRDAHPSHEHLKDSVNLLNNMPSGKQMVNDGLKGKEASNPKIANLL